MFYTMLASVLMAAAGPTQPAAAAPAARDAATLALYHALARSDRPGIRLWTTQDDVYHRGDRTQVYFRTERDAYVTVFRVDTDGRVQVLYPRDPADDNFAHGGATYELSGWRRGEAFVVDDDPGVGYIFGVASSDPFIYDQITSPDHWALDRVADRIHGDPYNGLMDIVDHLIPQGYADYDTHLIPYYVEERYDYPRFVCYDCHTWVGFTTWDPYLYTCPRYSLYVYNDPFYFYPSYWYPTRYYGGTRVVYVSPGRGNYIGRYIFKQRTQPNQAPVVYRPRPQDPSAPPDRGVRGVDIGGVGSVPDPGVPGRRTAGGFAGAVAPPPDPPIIRGDDIGRRPVIDRGAVPADQGSAMQVGPETGRRAIPGSTTSPDTRGISQAVVPATRTGEQGRPAPEPQQPETRGVARPADPGAVMVDPGRSGTYTPPTRQEPQQRGQPSAEPPRREAPPPSAPAPRASPPPRAEPARSSPPPRAEPAPRLERRRP